MKTLQAQDINLAFADRDLLRNVSFTLDQNSRVALVGGNGEGKSTLLKIVCGAMEPDSGTISRTKDSVITYLPQSDIVLGSDTVAAELDKAFESLHSLEQRRQQAAGLLAHDAHNASLVIELGELDEKLQSSGYYDRSLKVAMIAHGLGFEEKDMGMPCSTFSGGYQMRIALAKVLLSDPDFMLLDEPTNYLDLDTRVWLKNYLKTFKGAVMLVCHDRYFLDQTINEVYELFNSNLKHYSGNYSEYERQRQLELDQLEAAFRKQQAEIEKAEAFIEKFRYKATKSRQVQSRVKALEKIEPVVIPGHLKKLVFHFPPAPHSPNTIVNIEGLHKQWSPDKVIYDDFSLHVAKGEHLAVTGHNGIGKTTLLRIIAGEDTDYTGTVSLGPGVKPGFFAQDNEKGLDPSNTVLEEIQSVATTADLPRLRSMLGAFLFQGDDIYKSVGVLSGGERSRLSLLKILLHPTNLLILDEPTNHLDINAKDMLLDALKEYEGTLIFVSHDNYFIKDLATSILYVSHQAPELFKGDYEYFAWKMESRDSVGEPQSRPPAVQKQVEEPPAEAVKPQAFSREESKRQRAKRSKLKASLEDLETLSLTIKARIKADEDKMALEEYYSDGLKMKALADDVEKAKAELERTEGQWLETSMALEELDNEAL
ncbi:MAG: ABC-F family ATP-binding cassette domain-containing protein [Sphaerochaetaceae bacterium]|jgi:ATP-binding cassette subfamily F protein 3|nr:ABC-F family ATP-binding cassette domain-containing protein [Sphaerochaetaceae bacterium]